ncbi:hypothetical protein BOTBODRAFT_33567 [Botryobasidium botryosum FD-172 SS1]|uniref:CNNM transmembrane domain-containing protein n=1 Tax=Botryobasidium botryosum (strain FD-172 SS1) TaxID=930990 RepID=A0A067MNU1_BOTB1|nr:hypothetical protein BOTBODRAFT_33567 [Botryobasidium botryosum FD-172 SS1]
MKKSPPLLLAAHLALANAALVVRPNNASTHHLVARKESAHYTTFIVEAIMIPFLVILSGILAGLTLGYMSLDETQLRVLAVSGTPKQRRYAAKIEPIRKNGHLLLTTLLLGNMVVNETLPVISESVLGGGILAVVVSTVLIVIFAEIIPQSLCSRYGLQIGAAMAVPTQILIYLLFVVAWPVAKVLEFVLGPHHGIIYRRGELKELINMHSAVGIHGGDLQSDTVAIVGGALDFQEKIVSDAMTPIEQVFMLSIEAKLDYEVLARVVKSGHSRVPVYEEIEVGTAKMKKIIGILLVKQCVLLDPEDATPLRDIPLNKVPTVPFDEPLLGLLDRFQEGNSHMAVVSRIPRISESKDERGSVHQDVKVGLTRRFLNKVLGDHSEEEEDSLEKTLTRSSGTSSYVLNKHAREKERKEREKKEKKEEREKEKERKAPAKGPSKADTLTSWMKLPALEQVMPSDAILSEEGAALFIEGLQHSPLGIITLEDLIEELIGEEIYDEFDLKGAQALPASQYVPAEAQRAVDAAAARRAMAKAKSGLSGMIASAPGIRRPRSISGVPVASTSGANAGASSSGIGAGGMSGPLRGRSKVAKNLRAMRMVNPNVRGVRVGEREERDRESGLPRRRASSLPEDEGGVRRGRRDLDVDGDESGRMGIDADEVLGGGGLLGSGMSASGGGRIDRALTPTTTPVGTPRQRPVGAGGALPPPMSLLPPMTTGPGKKGAFKSVITGPAGTPGLERKGFDVDGAKDKDKGGEQGEGSSTAYGG